MKKRILSLLLAAAMLVLLAVPAFAEDEHAYQQTKELSKSTKTI